MILRSISDKTVPESIIKPVDRHVMYQSIPKPPIPTGQSPGIWLALSCVRCRIWPKMRSARWGIWLSCQNVCQRLETKVFRNSLIQHVSRVLVDSTWVFRLLSFYIVISWNMPLLKAWGRRQAQQKIGGGWKFCLGQLCRHFKMFTVSGNTRNDQSLYF